MAVMSSSNYVKPRTPGNLGASILHLNIWEGKNRGDEMPVTERIEVIILVERNLGGSAKAMAALNVYLGRLKARFADAKITLVLFAGDRRVLFRSRPVMRTPPLFLFPADLKPGAALHDSLAIAIKSAELRIRMAGDLERPDKVTFAILAGGRDRGSRHFSLDEVVHLIHAKQREDGWKFTFLHATLEEMVAMAGEEAEDRKPALRRGAA